MCSASVVIMEINASETTRRYHFARACNVKVRMWSDVNSEGTPHVSVFERDLNGSSTCFMRLANNVQGRKWTQL